MTDKDPQESAPQNGPQTEEQTVEKEEPKREPITIEITDIELEELKQEAGEFKDKYFRQLAEQENTRKRLLKEKEKLIEHAYDNVIVEFLTPIDQMEAALKFTHQMSEEVKHWAMGFDMILTQFKDILANHGIKTAECEGKHYDPHLHHVTETVETEEYPPGTIIKETLKGYYRGDKPIRAAHVTVAKAPKKESLEEKPRSENNE